MIFATAIGLLLTTIINGDSVMQTVPIKKPLNH
jgi:hypothetical protein